MSVRDNITEGKYANTLPWVTPRGHQAQCPGCKSSFARADNFCKTCGYNLDGVAHASMQARQSQLKAFSTEANRVNKLFKDDALTACGIFDHPKAEKAWMMAWERGHSGGLESVLSELEDLVDLLA